MYANGLVICGLGALLVLTGIFMYRSPRAREIIERPPIGPSQVWRYVVYLVVLGLVPEGFGVILIGLAQLLKLDAVELLVYIVANLVVLGLWLTRPKWATPYWMRTR
jgi:hypothetical protein